MGYGAAVLLSVILGILIFSGLLFGMKGLKIWLGILEPVEIKSQPFNLEQVEISSQPLPEIEDEIVVPENLDSAELLAEVEELIPELDDTELDISPDILQPEVALEASIPLDAGEEFGELLEPVAAPEVEHVLDQIGRTENLFQEAAAGQIMVEEGSVKADIIDPDELLKDIASEGSGGLSDEGLPSGYASIDGLLRMASSELSRSRAALPSDLLFEYDSSQLRETARLGMMKLAMLIDRNPQMYCVLEGHSDLFGDFDYNLNLSARRARAVKSWLVESMQLDGERIIVRSYGSTAPKVEQGSIEEQAINRRVDILMRKSIPPQPKLAKEPEVVVEETIEEVSEEPKPLVTPSMPEKPIPLALPVPQEPPVERQPLKALKVEDERDKAEGEQSGEPKPLRALPVE